MKDSDLYEKRVCIRVDFNVPIRDGHVLSDARLKAALPSIQKAIQAGARVLLLSHFGRPKEGEPNSKYSLEPVAKHLTALLKQPVRFAKQWLDGVEVLPKEVVLCENVRFNVGEKANDAALAKKMAALCDVFVMDAFASAHREEASTVGIAQYASRSVAGLLMVSELNALEKALKSPKKPVVAIVGGAKVSDKIHVIRSLLDTVDTLIVGGGIANTFIRALGCFVGNSLFEPDLVSVAKELLSLSEEKSVQLMVPKDVVVATELSKTTTARECDRNAIQENEKILDVGSKSSEQYAAVLEKAGTIIWNGPIGVFEVPAFSKGTEKLAKSIAKSSAFSIAGGGETLAAIEQYGIHDKISCVSTGGGAFLAYLEGKDLPAVRALEAERSPKN